jgi:hypothetical protein
MLFLAFYLTINPISYSSVHFRFLLLLQKNVICSMCKMNVAHNTLEAHTVLLKKLVVFVKDGEHQCEDKAPKYTDEQLKLIQSQDLRYVQFKLSVEQKVFIQVVFAFSLAFKSSNFKYFF